MSIDKLVIVTVCCNAVPIIEEGSGVPKCSKCGKHSALKRLDEKNMINE